MEYSVGFQGLLLATLVALEEASLFKEAVSSTPACLTNKSSGPLALYKRGHAFTFLSVFGEKLLDAYALLKLDRVRAHLTSLDSNIFKYLLQTNILYWIKYSSGKLRITK